MKNFLPIIFSIVFMTAASAQVYFKTHVVQEDYPSTGIAVIDLDGEGDLDLVRLNKGRDEISLMLNNGLDQPFEAFNRESNYFSPRDLIVGDFDNDGDQDFSCWSKCSKSDQLIIFHSKSLSQTLGLAFFGLRLGND